MNTDTDRSTQQVLDEIAVEPLQNLLAKTRCSLSFIGSTHIAALDAYFSHGSPLGSSLRWGDVIEIQGPASSGKTHLLYHLLAICLLPPTHVATNVGGWGKAAVVFDTDGTFDIRRLHQILLGRLSNIQAHSPLDQATIQELIYAALAKLHVFLPTSSNQLAATLLHLPMYYAKNIQDIEFGILAIDSLNSFCWSDRFLAEKMHSFRDTRTSDPHSRPIQNTLFALQHIRLSYAPLTILTNWGLNHTLNISSGLDSATSYQQYFHSLPLSTLAPPPQTKTPSLLPSIHYITLSFSPISPSRGTAVQGVGTREQNASVEAVVEVTGFVKTAGSARVEPFLFWIGEEAVLTEGY